jgi:cell division protein FtsI (penicillin-binding protein 3)
MARLTEKIVANLGASWYRKFLAEVFGLGVKSGIEFPAESSGMLPAIGKRHRNNTLEWSAGTPYTLAIGYNLQVNSIHLVRAYAVLANGGYLVEPTLVRKIVRPMALGEGVVLLDNTTLERQQRFRKVLNSSIARQVVKAMKFTTKVGGTAPKGDVYGYTEAGKSSTSKKIVGGAYVDTYRSSFIGFTPVEQPAFVLLVAMDEPAYGFVAGIGKTHHGGINAAPVFRAIAQRTLEYLGITPDDPYGYAAGDPRTDAAKADWQAEAKILQATYREWNGAPGK